MDGKGGYGLKEMTLDPPLFIQEGGSSFPYIHFRSLGRCAEQTLNDVYDVTGRHFKRCGRRQAA